MWVSNCSSTTGVGAGSITEFGFEQLKHLHDTPAPSPVITLEDNGNGDIFGCPYGGEFDPSGNLWAVNHFLADVIEFTPAQLQQGGVQFPNTEIDSLSFEGPVGHAFDSSGALWISDFHANLVFGFTAQTLATSSGQTVLIDPDIINSAAILDGPAAVTFDRSGNQWVANCLGPSVTEFAPLSSSGSPTPLVTLTSTTVTTPTGSAPSLACPDGLAFDRQGNLWVANAVSDNRGSLVQQVSARDERKSDSRSVARFDARRRQHIATDTAKLWSSNRPLKHEGTGDPSGLSSQSHANRFVSADSPPIRASAALPGVAHHRT
jgi:hypothetical protein